VRNRRLIPLGLGAVVLLAVVALAARGGSLHSGGGGSGPSALFWDYTATTLLAIEILLFIGGVYVLVGLRPDLSAGIGARKSSPRRTLLILIFVLAFNALLFYVLTLLHKNTGKPLKPPIQLPPGVSRPGKHVTQHFALQWGEIIVVLSLVAAAGVAYVVQRKRLGETLWRPRVVGTAPEAVAAALDESLDDLRSDPDLRRAIVAAYARMETALAVVGLPRDPAEAPLEYLERVLLSLDASAEAVRRLTDLFEWARFSHHEPEPSMRDDAVDALIAVRDELRNAERLAA